MEHFDIKHFIFYFMEHFKEYIIEYLKWMVTQKNKFVGFPPSVQDFFVI